MRRGEGGATKGRGGGEGRCDAWVKIIVKGFWNIPTLPLAAPQEFQGVTQSESESGRKSGVSVRCRFQIFCLKLFRPKTRTPPTPTSRERLGPVFVTSDRRHSCCYVISTIRSVRGCSTQPPASVRLECAQGKSWSKSRQTLICQVFWISTACGRCRLPIRQSAWDHIHITTWTTSRLTTSRLTTSRLISRLNNLESI